MKNSWQNIADILAEPSAAFTRLKSEPKWVLAIIIFCLFSVGIAWAMFPFTEQIMHQQMTEAGVAADQIEISIKVARIATPIGALIVPIIWLLVISAVLTLVARLLLIDEAIKFKHIYAAVVHTSLIIVDFRIN